MNVSVLIVDDEPHARRYIRNLLLKDDEIEIIGECKNGREALNFIANRNPDIILLDIQMPGINGLEVAHKLKSSNSLVIFTTAYDQYALKAFEVEAMNYLLKPFDEKRFSEVINKAKDVIDRDQQARFSEKMISLYSNYKKAITPHLKEFVIKDKGIDRIIKVSEVVSIEARSVYVILNTDKDSILYRSSLNLLDEQLPPDFLRVHRSHIININHIINFKYLNNNTFSFNLSNNRKIISSRSYKTTISNTLSE